MKNVLLVMLEFDNWNQARAWSYTGAWGFREGLVQNGFNCTVMLATRGKTNDDPREITERLKSFLKDNSYDQAWIWCVHTQYDQQFWDLLREAIPIRVGIVMESLIMTAAEIAIVPHFLNRKQETFSQLSNCTHAIAVDEEDLVHIESELNIPAHWNTPTIPDRFIRTLQPPAENFAVFIGNNYGPRKEYLEDPTLQKLMIRPNIPERQTNLPDIFDELHLEYHKIKSKHNPTPTIHAHYTQRILETRDTLFNLHLDGIRMGFCSVSLPSIVKAHTPRITEAMAASTPAISWIPSNRPRCASLFKNEIDYLEFTDKKSLVNTLHALKDNKPLRETIVNSGRSNLLKNHTSKITIGNYINWITNN